MLYWVERGKTPLHLVVEVYPYGVGGNHKGRGGGVY